MAVDHTRPIRYDYYGPKIGRGKDAKRPRVKTIRGSNIAEVNANVARWMTQKNSFGAEIADVTDETYGELLCVATYLPGEKFQIVFERDVHRPVCVTDFEGDKFEFQK